jgi:hypothetical protein
MITRLRELEDTFSRHLAELSNVARAETSSPTLS